MEWDGVAMQRCLCRAHSPPQSQQGRPAAVPPHILCTPVLPHITPYRLQYDKDPFAQDEEERALEVQENMRVALANQFPRPFFDGPTAGAAPSL